MNGPGWPGARNLRDLGGRALRDGGTTVPGRVFRSAAPEYLTDDGWRAARAAGLRTVVDLRNAPAETGPAPDHPVVDPASRRGLVVHAAPTEDPDDAEFLRVCGPWLDHPRCWADNARLAPDRIARVLRLVATSGPGVLVHCAGGRDRTGMISAMLLDLAGATEDAVVDDYADGWRGAGDHVGPGWVYDPQGGTWTRRYRPRPDPVELERQLAERVPALRHWFRTFDTTAYAASVGLTAEERRALRELLRPH